MKGIRSNTVAPALVTVTAILTGCGAAPAPPVVEPSAAVVSPQPDKTSDAAPYSPMTDVAAQPPNHSATSQAAHDARESALSVAARIASDGEQVEEIGSEDDAAVGFRLRATAKDNRANGPIDGVVVSFSFDPDQRDQEIAFARSIADDVRESPEGWPTGAVVAIVDRRPETYQIYTVLDDLVVNLAAHHGDLVDRAEDWALAVVTESTSQ